MLLSRRALLLASASLAACARRPECPPAAEVPRAPDPFAEIEARIGGRVGVFALDTGSRRTSSHRPDERFAMCSTFKWILAAAVLARAASSGVALSTELSYDEGALLEYAPITRAHVAEGRMTLAALAEAAVTVSDNTAANLLLGWLGGPSAVTAFLESVGDKTTRLDRNEPTLNDNLPGDPRDTTTPRAMVQTMETLLVDERTSASTGAELVRMMRACTTGKERLRAGLPADFVVGDKTGTGNRGASNDVAIVLRPARTPLLVASYLSESTAPAAELNRAHADIARAVALL